MKLMKTPKSVDLEITNRCNLRCKYCSHFSSDGDVDQDLATEEWLQFFEELRRCAVMEVCLQGGEPFIRKDFKDLVAGIVKNRMRFSVLSNGTLITDDLSAFLATTGRCNSVQVSIDGSVDTTHDTFRGKGNFHKALSGLKSLMKHKLPTTVRVTIHRKNVHDLDNIARLLLEEVGLPSFSTNSASHLGLCRQNADQVMLTAEERTLAMETLLRLIQKYNGRISAQAGPLAEARGWLKMVEAKKQGLDRLPNRGYLTGCGGFMSKMAVRADGVMLSCNLLPAMELGRINRDDLGEVWRDHPKLNRFRNRRSIPLSDFEYCADCEYMSYCTGSCPALAYTLLNDPYQPSPEACLKRFLEQGGRLPETPVSVTEKPETTC